MPLSPNQQDNEKRKFKADSNNEVAVNVCGEQFNDIVDAVNGISSSNKDAPVVSNTLIVNANTEYSHAFGTGVKAFTMRARENNDIKFSYATGTTNTTYMTLKRGAVYTEDGLNATGLIIYFESLASGITVEIVEWT